MAGQDGVRNHPAPKWRKGIRMKIHGGLAEILRMKQPPAGFVKQATGEVTTTTAERKRWKSEADFIQRKKTQSKGMSQHFERIAVCSQASELELHRMKFDGDSAWSGNKDAINFLKRAGHPIATMNPALSSEGD